MYLQLAVFYYIQAKGVLWSLRYRERQCKGLSTEYSSGQYMDIRRDEEKNENKERQDIYMIIDLCEIVFQDCRRAISFADCLNLKVFR